MDTPSGAGPSLPRMEINKASGTLTITNTGGSTWLLNGIVHVAGTVDASSSSFNMTGSGTYDTDPIAWDDVSTSGGGVKTVSSDMTINGKLTVGTNHGTWTGGSTLKCRGDISWQDSTAGAVSVLVDGTGAQQIDDGAGTSGIPEFEINKASGTLTFVGDANFLLGFTFTAGTVDFGGSTVRFFGVSGHTIDSGSLSFNNIIFSGGDATIIGTMDVDGDFTITTTTTMSGGTIELAGNLISTDVSVGGTLAITLDGTGTQNIDMNGGTGRLPDGTFTIDKASGSAVLTNGTLNLNATGQDLVITQGELNIDGIDLTVTDTITVGASGTLRLEGGETVTRVTFTADSGSTVIYDGTATFADLEMGLTYSNLTFDGVGGDWSASGNVTIESGLTLTDGTLNAGSNTWGFTGTSPYVIDLSGGSFNADTSTFNLTGSGQSTFIGTTFFNLTFAASATHLFTAGSTTTVTNILDSNGTAGTRSILRSTIGATEWFLDLQGASLLANKVDVEDSDASAGSIVDAAGSLDTGNNTNWNFAVQVVFWTNGTVNGLWNTNGNWTTGLVPQSNEVAKFSPVFSTDNCAVNVNVSIEGIKVISGYTGIISQGAFTITLDTEGYIQSDGTFTGGTLTIDVEGVLTIDGGTFTSTTGRLEINGDFTVSGGGVFTNNNGLVSVFQITATDRTWSIGSTILNE